MSGRVQWIGLQEFRSALRDLPEHLADEAGAIVTAHAAEAERLVSAAYPQGPTGALKRGVQTTHQSSRFGTASIVRSGAPHAHLFERGTRMRQHASGKNTGAMPAAPAHEQMIPIIVRVRRRMHLALMHLLERAGFQVVQS